MEKAKSQGHLVTAIYEAVTAATVIAQMAISDDIKGTINIYQMQTMIKKELHCFFWVIAVLSICFYVSYTCFDYIKFSLTHFLGSKLGPFWHTALDPHKGYLVPEKCLAIAPKDCKYIKMFKMYF